MVMTLRLEAGLCAMNAAPLGIKRCGLVKSVASRRETSECIQSSQDVLYDLRLTAV